MDRVDVYTPITKREKDPKTGHLYVYGKMTGTDLDHDQQRMDGDWLKSAVPSWARIGNIREMHQAKAVGKAVEISEKSDGWYLGAKIVDKTTIEKIENDILTGFSIGIKGATIVKTDDAPNGTIRSGRICETSVVDSPCLPSALFTIAKADSAGNLQPVEDPTLVEKSEAEHIAEAIGLLSGHYLTKADDETADITGARAAIAAILPLVQHEIDGLTAGDQGEQYDVSDLLTALSALTSFLASEVAESQEDKMDDATKAEIAQLVKAEVATVLAESQTELVDTLTKALKPEPVELEAVLEAGPVLKAEDIAKAVSDAVVEQLKPITDGLAAVTKKVDEIPAGGGPAITRTGPTADGSLTDKATERARLLLKADNPAITPMLRDEYRRQAEALTV